MRKRTLVGKLCFTLYVGLMLMMPWVFVIHCIMDLFGTKKPKVTV